MTNKERLSVLTEEQARLVIITLNWVTENFSHIDGLSDDELSYLDVVLREEE